MFSVTLAVTVGVVIGVVAWLCVPRERGTPAIPELVALPEIPMDPIEVAGWGRSFREESRKPIVAEAIRRLQATSHEDTVINALDTLRAYDHTIETDLIPIVEPLALQGPTGVRAAALVALCRACRAKNEDGRSFRALSRALTSGVRELETTAVQAMHPFDTGSNRGKMALMLLPFFQDPDRKIRERAA